MRHDFALKNIQARRICLSCSHDRHGLALSCWTCSYMSALLLKHCLILKFPLKRFLCQRAACTASQILLYLQGAFCAQQALVHEFFLLHYTTACHGALLPSPRTHQLADQGGNIIHKRLILRRGPHFPGTMQARRRCKSCSQSGPCSCAGRRSLQHRQLGARCPCVAPPHAHSSASASLYFRELWASNPRNSLALFNEWVESRQTRMGCASSKSFHRLPTLSPQTELVGLCICGLKDIVVAHQ